METLKVGIQEFRTHLPHYLLETGQPVAVTRHGETIGYFIPSRESKIADDIETLKTVAAHLDALLAAKGISEEDIVSEFKKRRIGEAQ